MKKLGLYPHWGYNVLKLSRNIYNSGTFNLLVSVVKICSFNLYSSLSSHIFLYTLDEVDHLFSRVFISFLLFQTSKITEFF